jgi:GH25 family lysozyme M1 (1,4-beta-N-acetylmuramidase)
MNFDNHGIFLFDISYGQGYPPHFPVTNFRKMRDYGASAVVCKASQRNYADPSFEYNWPAAKGILPRSSYHYYDNTYSAIGQAKVYWDVIKSDMEGVCWLDLEDRDSGTYRGWRYWYDWLETFKLLSGLPDDRIGIYTAYYYWMEEMQKANTFQQEYFKRYPLWLADYGKRGSDPLHPDLKAIIVPKPWYDSDCLMVQTGTPVIGLAAGVSSKEIDYNVFNGGMDKFNQVFKPVAPAADIRISIRSAV